MFQVIRYLVILVFLALLPGCDKEATRPEYERSILPGSPELRSVFHVDRQNALAAGGSVDQEGYIFMTRDGGQSWEKVLQVNWCVHDVAFLDSVEGYACGDSLRILRTRDGGATWEPVHLSWYPNPEYILPLKHISFADDTTWFFTGGRHYQYGINVRTQNGGLWWDNEVFQVELNSAYFRDEQHGLLAGYGIIYTTPDANVTFVPNEFSGDNITSLSFRNPMNGFACGFNGGIYATVDGGISWETRLKPNGLLGSRVHLNAIGSFQSDCLAVGENGAAFHSSDNGVTWTKLDLGTNSDLNDVELADGQFIVVGDGGTYLRVAF